MEISPNGNREIPIDPRLHTEPATFIVGIGGHPAPPNCRLPGYILPAIKAATVTRPGDHRLILATSANATARYNHGPLDAQGPIATSRNTRAKLEFLFAFIDRFFPGLFREKQKYFGHVQEEIDDTQWGAVWGALQSRSHPHNNDFAAAAEIFCGRPRGPEYAVRHAFWFRDVGFPEDTELPFDAEELHISSGDEKEGPFNAVRQAVCSLPKGVLEDLLHRKVSHRTPERIIRTTFHTGTPTPYGAANKGHDKSAEVDMAMAASPLSLNSKLRPDLEYILRTLHDLTGATRDDFLAFWEEAKTAYAAKPPAADISSGLTGGFLL